MNHLEEAKKYIYAARSNNNYGEVPILLALIAIAEQLERMNDQELRTEKLDFHTITRKVDK